MTLPAPQKAEPGLESLGSADLAPPSSNLLHGVTLRPPILSWNGMAYCGPTLAALDTQAAEATPGVVQVLVLHNFVGIVASQAQQARQARARLHPRWVEPTLSSQAQLESTQATPQAAEITSASPASGNTQGRFSREYVWQAQNQQDADASWAIAQPQDKQLTVWASCHRPDLLRREIAQLCALPTDGVRIVSTGQRHDAYDVAVEAALLAVRVNRAVRVAEDGPPHTPPLHIQLSADSTKAGAGVATTSYRSFTGNQYAFRRPSVAALLCGVEHHYAADCTLGTKGYGPDFTYEVKPVFAPLGSLGASSALPAAQVFARESFLDEWYLQQGKDPVRGRLEDMPEGPGRRLIESVTQQAHWNADGAERQDGSGRGFAYAHIVDHSQEPPRDVWSAWVAEVEVNRQTGAVDITRLTVGHDSQSLDNAPQSERIEETIRDAAVRWLPSRSGPQTPIFSEPSVSDAATSALSFPKVELVRSKRSLDAPLAWSPQAELPAAAAIANAIYDATGIRLRQAPFDGLNLQGLAQAQPPSKYRKWAHTALGGLLATVGGVIATAMPWRPAIAPVAVDTSVYSEAAIERGRLVAAAGDCMVCHTADGGQPNAGGRPLETPFGIIYTTNITPDKETGIGGWSYAAFERAMREGIHRDGRHLYPAFPYTSFAKLDEGDMQSLYAYLMTQPAVQYSPPKTELPFPLNIRSLVSGWNLLYLDTKPFQPDPNQSELWNRGAYLVQGAGHCAACHSPRNALGAEKKEGLNYLGGGFAEGWEAPALNSLSKSPIPWTEDDLYEYLRTGYSPLHGVAAGPMAPIIQGLAELPESDVRAMAHYLSSINPPSSGTAPALLAAQLEDRSKNDLSVMALAGEDLFQGACAVCHDARGGPPLFGARPSLALNTNLHSDHPDNAIQVLLHGIADPTDGGLGYMPGFKDSMNDEQIVRLLEYMRARFAPDKPEWSDLPAKVSKLRNTTQH